MFSPCSSYRGNLVVLICLIECLWYTKVIATPVTQLTNATTTSDIPIVINHPHGLGFSGIRVNRDRYLLYQDPSDRCKCKSNAGTVNILLDTGQVTTRKDLPPLTPGTRYRYVVQSVCCQSQRWIPNYLCTRAAAPIDVSAISTGDTTAKVFFTTNPDNIHARDGFTFNSVPPSKVASFHVGQDANFVDVDGLEPGVPYVFQVKQKFICRNPVGGEETDLSSEPVWTGPVIPQSKTESAVNVGWYISLTILGLLCVTLSLMVLFLYRKLSNTNQTTSRVKPGISYLANSSY